MERCDTRPTSHGQTLLHLMILVLLGMLLLPPNVWSQGRGGVLRIGMTAADIPYTGGQPDQGFEGLRFIGFQLRSYWIPGSFETSSSMSVPSNALPRFRTL